MSDNVEISFVDENDFVKEVKWYFLGKNSQWDTMLTENRRQRLGKQATPWFSLSVSLFSLGRMQCSRSVDKIMILT